MSDNTAKKLDPDHTGGFEIEETALVIESGPVEFDVADILSGNIPDNVTDISEAKEKPSIKQKLADKLASVGKVFATPADDIPPSIEQEKTVVMQLDQIMEQKPAPAPTPSFHHEELQATLKLQAQANQEVLESLKVKISTILTKLEQYSDLKKLDRLDEVASKKELQALKEEMGQSLTKLNFLDRLDLIDFGKLDQLDSLKKLNQLDDIPSMKKMEDLKHLTHLKELRGLKKISGLDQLHHLLRLQKLDKLGELKNLEHLQALNKIDDLQVLNRVDDLEKLLKEHGPELANIENLQSLENLKSLRQLEKLHELNQLDKLDKLDQLHFLENLQNLDHLTDLRKLERLGELHHLDSLNGLTQLEQLKKLEQLKQLDRLDHMQDLAKLDVLQEKNVQLALKGIEKLSFLEENKGKFFAKLFTSIFLDIFKVVAVATILLFIFTKNVSRQTIDRFVPYLGFGEADRVNIALSILSHDLSKPDFDKMYKNVESRVKREAAALFNASTPKGLTEYALAENLTSYSYSTTEYNIAAYAKKEVEEWSELALTKFKTSYEYDVERLQLEATLTADLTLYREANIFMKQQNFVKAFDAFNKIQHQNRFEALGHGRAYVFYMAFVNQQKELKSILEK